MIIAGSTLEVAFVIDEDFTGGSATISYVSPTGRSGTWVAGVTDAKRGRIAYQTSPVDLSDTGVWKVWGTYTFADGGVYKTPAQQFTVYAEGSVAR